MKATGSPVPWADRFSCPRRPLLRRSISFLVVGTWVLSLVLLAEHEGFWEPSGDFTSAFANLREDKIPVPLQMGLYFMGKRVGTVRSRWQPLSDGHWTNIVNGAVDLSALNLSDIAFSLDIHMDSFKQLEYFVFEVQSPFMSGKIIGRRFGNHIDLRIKTNNQIQKLQIPYEPGTVVSDTLSPSVGVPNLKIGARWSITMIDPMTLRSRKATAQITGKETLRVGNDEIECYVVTVQYGSFRATTWLDKNGWIVKQQTPLGLTLIREPYQEPKLHDRNPFPY